MDWGNYICKRDDIYIIDNQMGIIWMINHCPRELSENTICH